MKLFTRYNRINIIASCLIFICGCIAFYFVLNYVLIHQLDESLETEKAEIEKYALQHNSFPEIINTDDQQVYFSAIATPVLPDKYSSTKTWNEHEHKRERVRTLLFGIIVQEKNYQVTVQKSQEYQQGLLKLIILIASVMIALILLSGYVINRMVLKNLWKPFYNSINEISNYHLHKQEPVNLPTTAIAGFNLLNDSLNEMTARIEADYKTLKEFTGNAAHEMQTPLAIISAKTESLIQDESILRLHHESIFTIEDSVKRLSKLNQSLLLLTKIENRHFLLNEKIKWSELLAQRLNELQDLIASQNLTVQINAEPVSTLFHQQLADILITNLINNAIRYNFQDGIIDIQLNIKGLTVSNTSTLAALETTKIFSRFYRHPQTKPDGSGLGLSIVQQICVLADYALHYQYTAGMHIFSVSFT